MSLTKIETFAVEVLWVHLYLMAPFFDWRPCCGRNSESEKRDLRKGIFTRKALLERLENVKLYYLACIFLKKSSNK